MTRTAALLLDLDGTLLHTLDDIAASVNYVRARYGLGPWPREVVRDHIGLGVQFLLEEALADAGERDWNTFLPEVVARFRAHHGEHLAVHTRPYPGVPEGLARLRELDCRLAVVSNKPEAFSKRLIAHFGLGAFVPIVLGGDTTPQKKPHPLPMITAAGGLGVEIGQCGVVGDSPSDILAGERAGCPVRLAATWGYRPVEALEQAPHTGLVHGFDQVVAALEEHG